MGFYGNITNTSKTTFSFDAVYANRYELESKCATDGVFLGRYALVEYETKLSKDVFKQVYTKGGLFYLDPSYGVRVGYNTGNQDTSVQLDAIVFVDAGNNTIELWKCNGSIRSGGQNYATFIKLISTNSIYTQNYHIDMSRFGEGRGFDSTVWVKTMVELNGKQEVKYVQIAELNTVVPTFDISADAPTQTPIAPHFDTSSTNVYYKLHWQPNWGFRVKVADDLNRSDDKIVQTKSYYDKTVSPPRLQNFYLKQTINPQTNLPIYSWVSYDEDTGYIVEEVDGNIFYNARGFDSQFRYEDDGVNELKLTTASSGLLYNSHKGAQMTEPADDIQELSIMLPAIGNSISKMWDIVYNKPDNGAERNRDISWNSTKGVRMIHPQDIEANQTDSTAKWSFDMEQASTLAGCINSVHDLMGMIVEKERPGNIDDASINKIYYDATDGRFYIKYPQYKFDYLEGYSPDPNTGLVNYPEDMDFASFVKRYVPVSLLNFEPNKYYYSSAGNYYLDNNISPAVGNKYYNILSKKQVILSDNYIPATYYYKIDDMDQDYYLDNSNVPSRGRKYYELNPTQVTSINIAFYEPNKYYYKKTTVTEDNKDPLANYSIERSPNLRNVTYYKVIQDGEREDLQKNPDTGEFETVMVPNWVPQEITLIPFEQNKYYIFDSETKSWVLQKQIDPNIIITYTLETIEKNSFYQPGIYYYLDESNYLLDINQEKTENREYYMIAVEQIDDLFYEPNIYYYKNQTSGKYLLDYEPIATAGRTYYIKNSLYVANDSSDLFDSGAEWNENVVNIPNTVALATRSVEYIWKELEGFSRDLNTIHGLLIRINNVMQFNDPLTRDPNTVQGCINRLQDLFDHFEELKPGHFLVADEYGRVANADWDTLQDFDAKNEQHEITTDLSELDSKWLKMTMDTNYQHPHIKLIHTYNSVENTNTISNKNDTSGNGNNKGDSDTLELYTPIVDSTGHIVGKNTEIVTLPYGFKTITASNSSVIEGWIDGSVSNIIADNTKDTFNINGGNKWIRFQTNADTDTLTVAHETHDINRSDKSATDLNNPKVNTITIQDIEFDTAGHVTANQNHTYTLPYGFKTITTNGTFINPSNKTLIANNTQDDVKINTGDRWINITADNSNNSLTITHENPEITTYTPENNNTPNFGESFIIEDWYFDDKGHKHSRNTHTVTIPKGSYTPSGNTGVITSLGFVDSTGAITSNSSFLGDVILGNYTAPIGGNGITTASTLAGAISTLDARIHTEEENRKTAINNLIYDDSESSNSNFVSKVIQTNGLITVEHSSIADNFTVNGETLSELKDRIDTLTGTNEGSIAYQIAEIVNENNNGSIDTLKEIASWITDDTTGAASMAFKISTNTSDITDLKNRADSLEDLVGSTAVNNQIIAITGTPKTNKTLQDEIEEIQKIPSYDLTQEQIDNFVSQDTITQLLERIEQLETRISVLESSIPSEKEPIPSEDEEQES